MPDHDTRLRLLELMLFDGAGGVGYKVAIEEYALLHPEYYEMIKGAIESAKEIEYTAPVKDTK